MFKLFQILAIVAVISFNTACTINNWDPDYWEFWLVCGITWLLTFGAVAGFILAGLVNRA